MDIVTLVTLSRFQDSNRMDTMDGRVDKDQVFACAHMFSLESLCRVHQVMNVCMAGHGKHMAHVCQYAYSKALQVACCHQFSLIVSWHRRTGVYKCHNVTRTATQICAIHQTKWIGLTCPVCFIAFCRFSLKALTCILA